ncbi:MAG: sulfatase-like hydrolase/transferase [Pseudomonadota bacterium]
MTSPNVLFIITDQQRADHTGFMGNKVIQTPNMDQIAATGTVFENAWVTNPVCMPNRSTIMTGRMPTSHGVIFNDRSLDWNANTFVRQFRKAGYRTGLIGKSHLQHGTSRNSIVPFRGEGAVKSHLPKGWDEIEHYERYLEGDTEDPEDFYGFDHIRLASDHGARVSGHHLQWALNKGGKQEDLFTEYDAEVRGQHISNNWWQVYQPPYAEELHSTTFVTEQTQSFIRQAHSQGKPWLTWCSFPDPHHPMTPPGDWFFRHRPQDMVLPESRRDPLEGAPAHLLALQRTHPRDQRNWVAPCGYGGDDELLREAIAATYGMIEMIDHGIGQILGLLDELGARENTIIVFTSDHGDMMGDHGLFLKGFMHYRGTLQIPLVINVPGRTGSRTSALASSIDLGPTLLDLCNLAPYYGIQGYSLESVTLDAEQKIRDHILIEDDLSDITAQLTPFPGKTRTLITQEFRYTRNIKGEEQLFNLVNDYHEMNDIKATDASIKHALVEQLMQAMMAADDAVRGAPTTL